MKHIHELRNSIQTYAWGSHTAIATLLGEPAPSETPQAELWMGAHPKAPSLIQVDNALRPLPDLIEKYPVAILGKRIAETFGHQLPFLFKVLAAEAPLSIQAHPNACQAATGYARENARGIPLDAPRRNYRDDRHKPECICALTPFQGLCGFRKIPEIAALLQRICPQTLRRALHELKARPDATGLRAFFQSMMTLAKEDVAGVIEEAVTRTRALKNEDEAFEWILKLEAAYPNDIGVIFPAILNLVCLQPGEALFLAAGELHAYLHGVGIEIMANSDNVLRGGLTPKHVDVPELMNVLTFQERRIDVLLPEACRPHEKYYRTPATEFVLSVIALGRDDVYEGPAERSAEILLMTEGKAELFDGSSGKHMEMQQGMSVIVPAAVTQYRIHGEGVVYKASVPLV